MLAPNVHIGKVDNEKLIDDGELDDDIDLKITPPCVIRILGFDPQLITEDN